MTFDNFLVLIQTPLDMSTQSGSDPESIILDCGEKPTLDHTLPVQDTAQEGGATGEASLIAISSVLKAMNPAPAAEAADALSAALAHQDYLQTVLRSLGAHTLCWLYVGLRSDHLQTIENYQQHAPYEGAYHVQNRLLLVSSCLSYAQDFREWEKHSRWQPDREQTMQLILQNQDPLAHSLSVHLSSFMSLQPGSNVGLEQLDSGLRVGTKLLLIDRIGRSLSLGSGLALLMGFECQKVSELSYAAIPAIRERLATDENMKERVRAFSLEFSSWWDSAQAQYHQYHKNDGFLQPSMSQAQGVLPIGAVSAADEHVSYQASLEPRLLQSLVNPGLSEGYSSGYVDMSSATASSYGWSDVATRQSGYLESMSTQAMQYPVMAVTSPFHESDATVTTNMGSSVSRTSEAEPSMPSVGRDTRGVGFQPAYRSCPLSLRDAWRVPSVTMPSAIEEGDLDDAPQTGSSSEDFYKDLLLGS